MLLAQWPIGGRRPRVRGPARARHLTFLASNRVEIRKLFEIAPELPLQ
jgi:hypothetical protein